VEIDPLSYGVDALRGTLGGLSQFGLVKDFTISGIVVIIFLAIASYLFSKIEA